MRKIAASLLTLTVLVAGCGGATSKPAATAPAAPAENKPAAEAPKEDGKLVISGFGTGADQFQKTVIDAFQKQYNIQVTMEVGNNSDRLTKLQAQKANPVIDVMLISDYFAEIGQKQGLFDKVDAAAIPNLADVYDFAKNADGFGPAYTTNRMGIAYNPEKIPGGIKSWKDLWKPEYKGYIAVPDMTVSYGPLFFSAAAKTYGKNEQDVEAGFQAFKTLKPSVVKYFTKTSEALSLMERGEVYAAPTLDLFVVNQQKSGKLKWVIPDEGSYRLVNTANIVKGTKRKQTAQQFINFLLSKEVQEAAATAYFDAPVNKKAELPADMANFLAYKDNATKGLNSLDQAFLVKNQQAWVDRFMREVSN
jgi:putative spermidine/putrescine transport system substrate-binding protein